MTRRLGLLLAALLLAAGLRADEPRRPNILFVLVDDLGWGDFSCFGNTEAKTPHIDRLAAEGLAFDQFYVNSPICSPSRCALLTGQYPQRWRITSYLSHRADNSRRGLAQWLDPQAPSLGRTLQAAGFATGHFGKWHLGGQRDVADAPAITRYGFDTSLTNFEGMGPKLLPLTRTPDVPEFKKIWADAERLGGPVTWLDRAKITTGYADAALRFIDEATAQRKPFFINLWPDDVHSPYFLRWRNGARGNIDFTSPCSRRWTGNSAASSTVSGPTSPSATTPSSSSARTTVLSRAPAKLAPSAETRPSSSRRHPFTAHRLGPRPDAQGSGRPPQ